MASESKRKLDRTTDKNLIASDPPASAFKIAKRKKKKNRLKLVSSLSAKSDISSGISENSKLVAADHHKQFPTKRRRTAGNVTPAKKFKPDQLQSVLSQRVEIASGCVRSEHDETEVKPRTKKLMESLQGCSNDSDNTRSVSTGRKEAQGDLRTRLIAQLQSSRFRHINEELYRSDSHSAVRMFKSDKEAFEIYHKGYQTQVSKWPINPVDKMVKYIKKCGSHLIVADFGCGDAKIAQSVKNPVHSFDLVALNEHVSVCDMSKVPLQNDSVDIAVFCLSLMGTNLSQFLCEANRILKSQGTLLIAEVVSRFENVAAFLKKLKKLGFVVEELDTTTSKMFVWIRLRKTCQSPPAHLRPEIMLKPCVYNRRKSVA